MTRFIFGIKKYLFHPTLICKLQIFSQCFIPYIFAQSCIFCENFVRDHTFWYFHAADINVSSGCMFIDRAAVPLQTQFILIWLNAEKSFNYQQNHVMEHQNIFFTYHALAFYYFICTLFAVLSAAPHTAL